MKKKPISVIGAGSWGTALSILLANNGYKVNLWVYEKTLCDKIKETRENNLFLPGFNLTEDIYPTNSLNEAIGTNEIVLLVIPTKFVRSISNQKMEPATKSLFRCMESYIGIWKNNWHKSQRSQGEIAVER